MNTRIEGQIWIDKNSPYRLKYHTRDTDYEVSVSQVYSVAKEEYNGLSPGMVVALNTSGKIERAVFPDDIERVIGIVGQKSEKSVTTTTTYSVSISKIDKLVLTEEDVQNVFVDVNEVTSIIQNIQDSSSLTLTLDVLKGAPIYWFIGRQKKLRNEDGSYTYTYTDSSDSRGKLTFCTPSGYQWKQTSIVEDCFNVGYDNLPIVGTVGDIICDKNGTITSLVINTNFTGFDTTIGWSYPYTDDKDLSRGVLTPDADNVASVDICHGLFPNSSTVKARCFCDIIAMPKDDEASDDTEFQVSAIVDNFYSTKEQETASEVRHTHIEVHTPDTYRYKIHGTVVYKFQKGAK